MPSNLEQQLATALAEAVKDESLIAYGYKAASAADRYKSPLWLAGAVQALAAYEIERGKGE